MEDQRIEKAHAAPAGPDASGIPSPRSGERGPRTPLDDLDPAQREAVEATSGPVGILAGAGSGKTRVISRRAAHAVATGVVDPGAMLLVTFTEKAAREMAARMVALGCPGVMARTFHAMALAQLSHFWPSRHDGQPLPDLLPSKARILVPLVRRLPGHYTFTPAKDVADAIEWAKVRRIEPRRWEEAGGDRAPIPADLFTRVYGDYERAKARQGLLDFEDLLIETVRLLEDDPDAAAVVRSRKRWFSVDEYQDTSPLAERLLELWLGESRDLCVVGDPDQTIYTFTGATPAFLLDFEARHPGARIVRLLSNYRSSPQILALANRLTHGGARGDLRPTRPDGMTPVIRRYADAAAELTSITTEAASLVRSGVRPSEIAVLVRVNAQIPPLEEAFARAGVPYRAGVRFFARRDVRAARRIIEGLDPSLAGAALTSALREAFTGQLGWGLDDGGGPESRERDASLDLLVELADALVRDQPTTRASGLAAELARRDRDEAASTGEGVELLTYHRAKGLEWRVVFLPALEEGLLPVRQAQEEEAIAEERRLLYVGITRARERLVLSWAAQREMPGRGGGARRPSRFLAALEPRRPARPGAPARRADGAAAIRVPRGEGRDGLLDALRAWRRERARADGVPAYVVAPDATLAAIADALPGSPAALRRVHGMGPSRVERYGPEIIALVAEHGSGPG